MVKIDRLLKELDKTEKEIDNILVKIERTEPRLKYKTTKERTNRAFDSWFRV